MDYQLYLIPSNGGVRHRVDLECRDDDHAIAVIESCIFDQIMELWQDARLVKHFDPAKRS